MDMDIIQTCPPPDPKTQPKITDFFQRSGRSPSSGKGALSDQQSDKDRADDLEQEKPVQKKRRRGRPSKEQKTDTPPKSAKSPKPTRKRGRPRKSTDPEEQTVPDGEVHHSEIVVEEATCTVLTTTHPTEEDTALAATHLTDEATHLTDEPPQKKRRRSFTVQKKQEIVEYAKEHSLYKAALHYKLSSGTIGPWMKKDFSKMGSFSLRASGSGRKLMYPPKFEPELTQWILEQRDLQPSISTQEIIDHACSLIQPSCPEFKGTRGWFQKFLSRNNLLNPDSEPLSKRLPLPLEEKISAFLERVKQSRTEHEYPLELIGNMDEVRVQIDMASNRKADRSKTVVFPTYTVGGEKQSYTLGAEKQHLTVVLTALGNGRLLPPMVIFRGVKSPKHFSAPSGWLVCVQESGNLDSSLMTLWMKEVWLKHTQSRRALLVMDCCHPHLTEDYTSVLQRGNTLLHQIPPGCSSKLQPVATLLASSFRNTCSKLCSEFYQYKLNSLVNSGDRLRSASREDIFPWLFAAYTKLTKMQDTVKQVFKVTGLTLPLDGSEDSMYKDRVDIPREESEEQNDTNKEEIEGPADVEMMAEPSGEEMDAAFEELDHSLDNSLKTLYNYMVQIQNKATISEADMQLLEEQLQSQ